MSALLSKANLDDKFRKQLSKLQDAIQALEKIADEFDDADQSSVNSQVTALAIAAEDVKKLKTTFEYLRAAPGKPTKL